jgi:hypothetical protein
LATAAAESSSLRSSGVERVGDLLEAVAEEVPVDVHRIAALAWPSICCTTFTSAPPAMARLAAVWVIC